jgi:phosphomannomutase
MAEGFLCPGDSQAIASAVHLARLGSGYAACRDCEFRNDVGSLPKQVIRQAQRKHARPRRSIMHAEGVRGISLNELGQEDLSRLVGHVLGIVDGDRLRQPEDRRDRQGPLHVVVGHDCRPSSPEMAMGVVQVLQRSGCVIADIGESTRPLFDFAMERLRPHLGLLVTGGTYASAWTGIDIVGSNGIPWCTPGRLDDLADRQNDAPIRLGRSAGEYHAVSFTAEYLAVVAHRFHAIRPLRLGIRCTDRMIRSMLEQVLKRTPCRVEFLDGADPGEDFMASPQEEFAEQIWKQHLDLGFLIGNDGRACRAFHDRGEELSAESFRDLMAKSLVAGERDKIILSTDQRLLLGNESRMAATEAELRHLQHQLRAPLAIDQWQRCWFLDESPQCDALLTLARLLEIFSYSEQPIP